jgi:pimeloyl-ACP methyl ester carboxylesterase
MGIRKVVIVTHSMGGLVARAACKFVPGFTDRVAGIVHTVQPTVGASIAYRRFLTGANDPGKDAFNTVLGNEWWKFLALMSVLPGPLELLPTDTYRVSDKADELPWLLHAHGVHFSGPDTRLPLLVNPVIGNYIKPIYPGLCFNYDSSVTGFSSTEWERVRGDLAFNLNLANTFHQTLGLSAHPTTSILASTDGGGASSTEAAVTGIVFDDAPFFKHAVRATPGDQTVPLFSAAILTPTEDGKPVPSPEKATPRRQLVDDVGEHSQVLKNGKAFDFVLENVKYFIQKAMKT